MQRLNTTWTWILVSTAVSMLISSGSDFSSRYGLARIRSFELSQTCEELVENAVEVPSLQFFLGALHCLEMACFMGGLRFSCLNLVLEK